VPDVGIYARISSDRDGDGLGVRRQLADCERLADVRGWRVLDRYIDDDVSAYTGRVRPEYRRMLGDLRAGVIEGVVVWHLDRLHRRPKELEEFLELCDAHGVSALASVSGDIDLGTHDGQLMARVVGAFARRESDDKSRRTRRKHEELAQAGKIAGGGRRPYGFEADRKTIRESEAIVVRECSRRVLAGESVRSVCRDLNEREVSTSTGKTWTPHVMRRMLMSGRISGQREHRGDLVTKAEWPGIIAPAETAKLRALLSDPARRTNWSARRYLLNRLLRCGLCGATLVSRPREGGARGYVCARGPGYSGCGHMYALADSLEAFVVEAVLYRLDSPELAAALRADLSDPDVGAMQVEIDQSQEQLEQLAAMYGRREIALQEWSAARAPIEKRLTDARRRLSRLSRTSALDGHVGAGAALRERWGSLSLSRQQAIIAAIVEYVVVNPGRRGYNRFDATRFEPVWRV
jgi:site-specific DNA recombinase